MIKHHTDYSLLPHNTFGIDVKAANFVEFSSVEDIKNINKIDKNTKSIYNKKTVILSTKGRITVNIRGTTQFIIYVNRILYIITLVQ